MTGADTGSGRRFLVEPFLDYLTLERGLKPRTVSSYAGDLKRFIAFLGERGVDHPAAVDHTILHAWTSHLTGQGAAASSIRRAQSALRAYFAFLVAEDELDADPTDRMDGPRADRRLPEFLTQDEAARLVEAVDPDHPMYWRDRAILETLYATGIRVSELTNLSLQDLDLTEGTALVFGKGGKERLVPVGTTAVAVVGRYLASVRPSLIGARSGDAVFLNQRGG